MDFPSIPYYFLDANGETRLAQSTEQKLRAMKCMGSEEARVAFTKIEEAEVSTMFLCFDHAFGRGPPVLWETMIFGGPLDQYQDRCAGSREQALAMHEKACELARAKERIRAGGLKASPEGE